jgi:mannose-6-phosphate isomerase-like protein (cupin superfamily)
MDTMSDIQVTLADALAHLSADQPFHGVFERGDQVLVELYAPLEEDKQQPHDRDELYIVVSATGRFRRDDELVSFSPGDLLYAPAHAPHRFEGFSRDFRVWVIFYGPRRAS